MQKWSINGFHSWQYLLSYLWLWIVLALLHHTKKVIRGTVLVAINLHQETGHPYTQQVAVQGEFVSISRPTSLRTSSQSVTRLSPMQWASGTTSLSSLPLLSTNLMALVLPTWTTSSLERLKSQLFLPMLAPKPHVSSVSVFWMLQMFCAIGLVGYLYGFKVYIFGTLRGKTISWKIRLGIYMTDIFIKYFFFYIFIYIYIYEGKNNHW